MPLADVLNAISSDCRRSLEHYSGRRCVHRFFAVDRTRTKQMLIKNDGAAPFLVVASPWTADKTRKARKLYRRGAPIEAIASWLDSDPEHVAEAIVGIPRKPNR
jgi:hypothetical protein